MINLTQANSQITALNKDLSTIQEQISDGKRVRFGSDDITVYDQIQKFDVNIKKLDQINKSINFANMWETSSEEGIVAIETNLDSFRKELSVLATEGMINENIKDNAKIQLEYQMKNIYEIANKKHNDQYVYSGILTDHQSIRTRDLNGKIEYYYAASEIKKDTNTDNHNRQEYGITGNELFIESKLFEEYTHINRLISEPSIIMEETNKAALTTGLDRETPLLRQKIIDTIVDPIEEANYLTIYDKYVKSLEDWNTDPTEFNRAQADGYLNVLKGNSINNINAAGGKTILNGFSNIESFTSNTNGEYIATIPKYVENFQLKIDDRGANDTLHVFKKDGTHLIGPDLDQTTIDNNSTIFDVGATYKKDPNKEGSQSTIANTLGMSEYQSTIANKNFDYSGTTNPGVGQNTFGTIGVGTNLADETVKINNFNDEDLILIVQGSGSFDVSAEWDTNLGINSVGLDDELDRLFDMADIKYKTSEYLTAEKSLEYIDPDTGLATGVSEREFRMDELEVMYADFIKIDDNMSKIEAFELYNYTKNPFSHKIDDVQAVQDNVEALRARTGNNINYLENTQLKNEEIMISATLYKDKLEEIDPALAAMQLKEKSLSLQALYQVIAQIQQLSLVNYI